MWRAFSGLPTPASRAARQRAGHCRSGGGRLTSLVGTAVGSSSPGSELLSAQPGRRGFFASKWQKRLGHLLEGRRRPPVPQIPETEQLNNDYALRPLKPILNSKRSGVLAYKIGCMSLWDEWGEKHMVTVCQLDRLHVMKRMTIQRDGYEAVMLGLGYRSLHRQNKGTLGAYIKAGVGPKHHMCQFRVSSDCLLPVGLQMSVRHFVPGQWVFVSGWTKAKGYHGPMKRWGFSGGGSDKHGHKKVHRAHGSMGIRGVGKVWKGKKAEGHMGPDPRCVNCKVFRIEAARNLIFLKGPVPGFKSSVIKISDARGVTALKNKHIRLPYPTFIPVPGVDYPVTVQQPPQEQDPFLYPEQPLYQPGE